MSGPAALSGRRRDRDRRADLLPEVGESALKGRGREGNAWETGNKRNSGERMHSARPGQRHEGGHWLATRYCTASVISGHGRHRKPIQQRTASFTPPPDPRQGSSLQVTHWKLRALPTSAQDQPAGGGRSLGWESGQERPEPDSSAHRTAASALPPPGRPHPQRKTRRQIIPWEPVSTERCRAFGLLCAKTIHLLKLDNQSP